MAEVIHLDGGRRERAIEDLRGADDWVLVVRKPNGNWKEYGEADAGPEMDAMLMQVAVRRMVERSLQQDMNDPSGPQPTPNDPIEEGS